MKFSRLDVVLSELNMDKFDTLCKCDHDNIDISKKNLTALAPQAMELVELCICAIEHLSHLYGQKCDYDHHAERLDQACNQIPG